YLSTATATTDLYTLSLHTLFRSGQKALVKFTSYDYAIYGGLEGEVVNISPNTVRDEVKPEIFYYRVYIETASDSLKNAGGKRFPDRKSTRLNSSHVKISYAVFCL